MGNTPFFYEIDGLVEMDRDGLVWSEKDAWLPHPTQVVVVLSFTADVADRELALLAAGRANTIISHKLLFSMSV